MSSVLFPAQLKPTGLFPTHEDSFGKGGFVALTGDASSLSSEEIIQDFLNTNIIQQRRKEGMLVYISSLKQYYTCTSITGDSGISGDWSRQYFSGRYFYGATAPTAGDDGGNLLTGDKWFNTVVGSEFTFLPLTVSGDNVWVDIDQLGGGDGSLSEIIVDGITYSSVSSLNLMQGENVTLDSSIDESSLSITFGIDISTVAGPTGPTGPTGPPGSGKYFYGSTAPTVGEDGLTLGSKWFDNIVGSEFTYLPIAEGSSELKWIDIDHLGSVILEDQFVNISGDTMTGTLTGTSSFMDTSMIVSNSLSYENQPVAKIQKINGSTDDYSGYYPGTTGFLNLPRLVLEHNPSNSWGWPSAIDFLTRPIPESNISSISHRIGNLFSTGGISRLIFWGAPAQNSTYGAGTTGISAGLSGEGLTTLGYFQYAVGASDSGFHALKAFRTTEETTFQSNELTTSDYVRRQRPFEMYITLTKGGNQTSSYDAVGSNWNVQGFTDSLTGTVPEPDSGDDQSTRGSRYTILTEEMVGFPRPWKINVKRSFVRHRHTIVEQDELNEYPMIIMPSRGGPASMKWHTRLWNHGGSYGNGGQGYTGDYPQEWGSDQRERGAWAMKFPPEPTSWINEFSVSDSDVIVRWNGYRYDFNACSWFNYDKANYESASLVNDQYYNPGLDTEDSEYTDNVEMKRIKIATITDYDNSLSPFSESNPDGEKMTSLNTGDAYIIQITVHPEES